MKQKFTKTQLEEKIKGLEDGWRRTQADFDNFRKHTENMQGELLELAKADFMLKITPVLDNFKRAINHAPARQASQQGVAGRPNDEFTSGIRQIEKQLENILTNEGLSKIIIDNNTKFDPIFHEAISFEKNDIIPADTIIDELESGWMYKNKVLKPAKVRVSKGK